VNKVFKVSLSKRDPLCSELVNLGGKMAGTICQLLIEQSNLNWIEVKTWAEKRGVELEFIGVKFSKLEIDEARWGKVGISAFAYPEPQNDYSAIFGESSCPKCRVGISRTIPRILSRRPSNNQQFFGTNWLFDEAFASFETWKNIFKPLGVSCRPMYGPTGVVLETHVQLVVDTYVDVDVSSHFAVWDCEMCGKRKYPHDRFRPFPALLEEPSRPIARTSQWFGSDGSAQPLLINQKLRQELLRQKHRISYWPLQATRTEPAGSDNM
jgi:hypothetical protein